MINQKKKKNSDKTNSGNYYLVGATITGVLGVVTPLITFETGVFGFAVLVIFTMYTLFTLKRHWQAKFIHAGNCLTGESSLAIFCIPPCSTFLL